MIQKKFTHDVVIGTKDSSKHLKANALDGLEALEIYRDSFIGIHIKSLENTFPVTLTLMGQSPFRAHARRYMEHHPPHTASLYDFGCEFSSFLKKQPELKDFPLIHDMAMFEWNWHQLYHAADEPSFPLSSFQESATKLAHMTFTPSAHLRMIQSNFPLAQIWKNHMDHEMNKGPIEQRDFCSLVFRLGLDVAACELNEAEHYFLDHASSTNIAKLTENWSSNWPPFDQVLVKSIQNHWLVDYNLNQ